MQDCYHEDAIFYDPVFQRLSATEVRGMWKMLCTQAKDFELQFSAVNADEEYGSCNWTATYLFSKTERTVTNNINARFRFAEGKIIEHMDNFNLYNWSRQALGLPGLLLGWNSFFQNKIRSQAKQGLSKFMRTTP